LKTGRLEAFSDGVLAIVITIMVLELIVPEGSDFAVLKPLIPKFLSYILSFIYIGIYWNNHHHLFQATERVNGGILWANLALLFMLSLIPFTTAWMGENHFAKKPVAIYGINLLLCAVSFLILEQTVISREGKVSKIGKALKSKLKEFVSITIYVTGTIGSFFIPMLGVLCYAAVAVIWLIPDRRIEKQLK